MQAHEILRLMQDALGESGLNAAARLQGGLWLGDREQSPREGYLYLENAVLRSTAVGCRVYRGSDQSLPNNAATAVQFDAALFDPFSMWQAAAPTQVTVRYPGVYLATVNLRFATHTTGRRAAQIRLNGGTVIGEQTATPVNAPMTLIAVTAALLDEGDYLEALAFQNSGAALNLTRAAAFAPEFALVRLV